MAETFFNVVKANKHIAEQETKISALEAQLKAATEDSGANESAAVKAAEGLQASLNTLKVDFEAQAKENASLRKANQNFETAHKSLSAEVATLNTALAEKPSRDAAAIVAGTGTPNPLAATASGNSGAPLAQDFSKLTPFNRALSMMKSEDQKRAALKQ